MSTSNAPVEIPMEFTRRKVQNTRKLYGNVSWFSSGNYDEGAIAISADIVYGAV